MYIQPKACFFQAVPCKWYLYWTVQAPKESVEVIADRVWKALQSKVALQFVVKHAQIEYYVDQTPAAASVQQPGKPGKMKLCEFALRACIF